MTQIKLRRDTSANFTSKNPVLGIGEPAYETDTKKLKIGDGTTAYTQLEYFSTGGGGMEVKETSTANFNSAQLLETGLYYISGAFSPQNGPVPYAVAAMLITMKWYSDSTNQRIQQTWVGCEDLVANQIYTRYSKPNGVMNSWVRVDSNKIASSSVLGSIKVGNGLTISSDGTLSASGGSAPSNMMTTDTNQTITGAKTFTTELISLSTGITNDGLTYSTKVGSDTYICHPVVVREEGTRQIEIGDSYNYGLQLLGTTITDGSGDKFLTSGNVTAYVIEEFVDGTEGYRIWSNGRCEQWGQKTSIDAIQTITFLKTYANTNFTLLANMINSPSTAYKIQGKGATTSSASFVVSDNSFYIAGVLYCWYVSGELGS